jgi:hypothetical protein
MAKRRQTIQWPKEDRQYNGQKKTDRQYNGQKKTDRQYNGQKQKEQNINIELQNTTHKTKLSFNGQLILNL